MNVYVGERDVHLDHRDTIKSNLELFVPAKIRLIYVQV